MTPWRWAGLACALIVLVAVVLHWPSLRQPLDRDMAAHATVGSLATEGLLPYRDIVDNKQPLPYVVFAAVDVVAPRRTAPLRLTAALVSAAAGISILLMTSRSVGLMTAAVAGLLAVIVGVSRWVQGVDLNTEHLLVLTGTWAVLAPVAFRRWRAIALVAGVLLGVAGLTKAPGVLLAGPALWLLAGGGRDRDESFWATVLAFVAGAAIPVFVVVAYYAAHGAVGDLLYWNVFYNLAYVEVGTGSRYLPPLDLWPVLVVVAAGLLGATAAVRRRDRPHLRELAVGVLGWILVSYIGAKLGGRDFPHYYAPMVPAACVGVAVGIAAVTDRAWRPAVTRLAAGAVVATLTVAPIVDVVQQYGQNPDDLAIRLYRITQAVPWTLQDDVGAWVQDHAEPCDRLFVAENEPGFYWASGVRPATPYMFDGHIAGRPGFWDELAALLGADPPRWLIFPRSVPVWHPYLRTLQPLDYRVVATFAPVHVLELNTNPC